MATCTYFVYVLNLVSTTKEMDHTMVSYNSLKVSKLLSLNYSVHCNINIQTIVKTLVDLFHERSYKNII